MKKTLTILAFGASLLATPAMACQFTGSASAVVGALVGASGEPVPVAALALAFKNAKPGDKTMEALYAEAGCSWDTVNAEILRLNPSPTIPRSERFRYPSLLPPANEAASTAAPPPTASVSSPQPASANPAPAPAPSASPAPAGAAAPAPQPLPQTVDLSDLWSSIDELKRSDVSIRSELGRTPPAELTPDQRALVSQLATMPDLVAKLQNLPAGGVVLTSSLTPEQKAALAQVMETRSLVESYLGRNATDGAAVFGAIGVFVLGLLVFFLRRRVTKLEKSGVTHSVEDPRVAALSDEVTELRNRVIATEESVSDVREQTGAVDIRFGGGQHEALNALPEGEILTVDVIVDTEKKFEVCFKRVENELFKADEPKSKFDSHNPDTPIKDPLKFVRRNYKRTDGTSEFAGFMNVVNLKPAA